MKNSKSNNNNTNNNNQQTSLSNLPKNNTINNQEITVKLPALPTATSTLITGYKYNLLNSKAKLNEMISKSEIKPKQSVKTTTNLPNATLLKPKPPPVPTSTSNNQFHLPNINIKKTIKKTERDKINKPPRRKRRSRLPRIPKFRPIKSILNNRLSSMLKSAQHRNSIADSAPKVKKIRFSNISIVYKSNSARSIRVDPLHDLLETGSDVSKNDLESEQDENEVGSKDGDSARDSENDQDSDDARSENEEPYKVLENNVTGNDEIENNEAKYENEKQEQHEEILIVDFHVNENRLEENAQNNYIAVEENKVTENEKLNDDSLLFNFIPKEQIELKNISKLKTELPEVFFLAYF